MINIALAAGFTRTIETMRDSRGNVTTVFCNLAGDYRKGGLFAWANIYITFRMPRRSWYSENTYSSSVRISSRCDFTGREVNRGWWHANYAVKYIREFTQPESKSAVIANYARENNLPLGLFKSSPSPSAQDLKRIPTAVAMFDEFDRRPEDVAVHNAIAGIIMDMANKI